MALAFNPARVDRCLFIDDGIEIRLAGRHDGCGPRTSAPCSIANDMWWMSPLTWEEACRATVFFRK
jgi:hypothetical protein